MAWDEDFPTSGQATSLASKKPIDDSQGTSDWVALLRGKLNEDDDFAGSFERTPGKALHSIGVPYSDIIAVLARWQVLVEAQDDELSTYTAEGG